MQVVFIGPPGAGKGTQCQLLLEYLRAEHISTGALLREEIEARTDVGKQAEGYLSDGHLAPDHLVLEIIRHHIRDAGKDRGMLFDGFPRTIAQAEGLEDLLRENARPLAAAIELTVPEDEIVRRLSDRGREDDKEEVIRNRLHTFRDQTAPVLGFYRDRKLLHSIDAVGTTDEVFNRIRACVDACGQKAG